MKNKERIAQLEEQLSTLRREQAELLRQQAQFEVDVWHGRAENVELKAHLGAMEAEEKLQPLMDKLRDIRRALISSIHKSDS
jgi:hypothetical protein